MLYFCNLNLMFYVSCINTIIAVIYFFKFNIFICIFMIIIENGEINEHSNIEECWRKIVKPICSEIRTETNEWSEVEEK